MSAADFTKKQAKVGKRKLQPSSETRIDIKLARLEVNREASETAFGKELDEQKTGASVAEVIVQTRHHNAGMRKAALASIRHIVDGAQVVQTSGPDIAVALAARLMDDDPAVRCMLLPVLILLTELVPDESASLFASLLSPFMASALTKLHTSVRLDALAALKVIADVKPRIAMALIKQSTSLLESVTDLMDSTLHGASTTATVLGSVTGAGGYATYNSGNASDASAAGRIFELRSMQTLPRTRLSALECRLAVSVCHRRLMAIISSSTVTDAAVSMTSNSGAAHFGWATVGGGSCITPFLSLPSAFGYAHASSANVQGSAQGSPFLSIEVPASAKALYQLLQVWLDCGPDEAHDGNPRLLAHLDVVTGSMCLCLRSVIASVRAMNMNTTLLLAAAPVGGAGEDGDAKIMNTLQGIMRDPSKGHDHISVLRLCVRAVHTHVLSILPVRLSAMAGSAGTIEVEQLNARLMELAVCITPSSTSIQAAREHVAEIERAGGVPEPGGKRVEANSTRNRFALLAPAAASRQGSVPITAPPSGITDAAGNAMSAVHSIRPLVSTESADSAKASSAGVNCEIAYDPVADAYRHAWRVAAGSVVRLRRSLDVLAALHSRCVKLAIQLVDRAVERTAGRDNRDGETLKINEDAVLPAIAVLQYLLPHASTQAESLMQSLTRVHTMSPPRSSMRKAGLQVVDSLLREHGMGVWRSADGFSIGTSRSDVARLVALNTTAWLSPLPRMLWVLGSGSPDTTCLALTLLLHAAQRTGPSSPAGVVLNEVARQMVPLLYTVKGNGNGVAPEPAFGPWLQYQPRLQLLLLAFLDAVNGAARHGLLLRALAVLARHREVRSDVRAMLISSTVRVLLRTGQLYDSTTQLESSSSAAQMGAGVESDGPLSMYSGGVQALAWLLSVCTGVQVTACSGTVKNSRIFLVAPPSTSEAGIMLPANAEPWDAFQAVCTCLGNRYADMLDALHPSILTTAATFTGMTDEARTRLLDDIAQVVLHCAPLAMRASSYAHSSDQQERGVASPTSDHAGAIIECFFPALGCMQLFHEVEEVPGAGSAWGALLIGAALSRLRAFARNISRADSVFSTSVPTPDIHWLGMRHHQPSDGTWPWGTFTCIMCCTKEAVEGAGGTHGSSARTVHGARALMCTLLTRVTASMQEVGRGLSPQEANECVRSATSVVAQLAGGSAGAEAWSQQHLSKVLVAATQFGERDCSEATSGTAHEWAEAQAMALCLRDKIRHAVMQTAP